MKKTKIVKVLLACILCLPLFALSACSSKVDAKELLLEAYKVTSKEESMHMDLSFDMEMKMSMAGSLIKAEVSAEMGMDITQEPFAAYANMKMKMKSFGTNESTETEMYIVNEDDQMVQYSTTADGVWSKSLMNGNMMSLENFTIFDEKLVDQLNPKVVKSEKVNGKDTHKVEITYDKDSFSYLLSKMEDQLDSFEDIDLDNEAFDDFKLVYNIYVDKENKQILKIDGSFAEDANKLFQSMLGTEYLEGAEFTFEKADIEIEFSDFNKIKEIKVPEDVIDATDLQDEEEVSYGDVSTQTHAWESMIVAFDGIEVNVGETTLQTLLDAGYKVDESYDEAPKKIGGEDYEYISVKKDGNEFSLTLYNANEKAISLSEGVITYISCYSPTGFTLPNGITLGSSKEDVLNAYGEANSMYSEYLESWEYDAEGDLYKSLTIYFTDGIVDNINLGVY